MKEATVCPSSGRSTSCQHVCTAGWCHWRIGACREATNGARGYTRTSMASSSRHSSSTAQPDADPQRNSASRQTKQVNGSRKRRQISVDRSNGRVAAGKLADRPFRDPDAKFAGRLLTVERSGQSHRLIGRMCTTTLGALPIRRRSAPWAGEAVINHARSKKEPPRAPLHRRSTQAGDVTEGSPFRRRVKRAARQKDHRHHSKPSVRFRDWPRDHPAIGLGRKRPTD